MERGNGTTGAQKSVDTYSKTAHQAVDRAAQAASAAATRLGEHVDALGAKGEELLELRDQWLEQAKEYVREKPFQALGIAVATGFVLHMLLRSGK